MNMPIGVTNHVEKPYGDEKFAIPEDLTGGAAAGGKKAPPAKEDKKADPKKDKGKGKDEPDENEEEDRQFEMEDERIWTEMNLEKGDKSELPCAYMWALSKYEFIDILFKQGRYDETVTQIQAAKLECERLNDTYFMRLYYEILTMIRVHNGEIEESESMFDGLKQYADRLGHDDIKLAQFYGNMGEFFLNANPSRCIEVFKESRVLFWVNLQTRGLRTIKVEEHIDLENGNVKEEKIPLSEKDKNEQNKAPVEEKKDPKAKGKADPKGEPPAEKDYSNVEKVISFNKEMNHEMFVIDESEASKLHKNPNIYLLQMDNLIKVNLRYAQALCTLDKKYDLSIKVLDDTLRVIERCIYLNPVHKYMAHFLYGQCNKMLFIDKVKEFQKRYGVSTATRGQSKYHDFIEGVPTQGLAAAHLFYSLPNYSNNIRNNWKKLLSTAKEHLEKCVAIAKNE